MSERLRILLTNDDGYQADGIATLYRVLARAHEVYLVAPNAEQSAASHSLTLNRPLRVQKIDERRYTTDGTPTDCVMLGVHLVFKDGKPDMIISGINHGANMGDDVTYSGTVAAAIEGSIMRVPSVAVSMAHYEPGTPMVRAANFVARLVRIVGQMNLPPDVFLNVNLPLDTGRPYGAYEFTRQGFRQYKDVIIRKTDPRGKPYYWIGGRPKWRTEAGTDFEAVSRNVVSITPLRLNFTDDRVLAELRTRQFSM
ncbi:MAG TPA: 5'/3'-nucleotidase SurE [candidate division Zixibacteria bacterium]|mgnify:CR=1 FL=1|nr:5'/3'-nucleotidase SurE [candidate division Zixibacteria bacterium]MDD4918462.1 5'/3'-nucleotidase SurE [candidate division Zixibacteria bacterium]MDM7971789.1 5'/3'-nucleotidase SurE [candidate division Zixibacteria bacterium]HOD66695.1 5'/3'-nucleotidase SurE [candidate division Zixibacteria bacterium]HPM37195.1 5'/3'-nucleotidase SurE [candidate division Zixibacteria bacterium]